MSPWTFTIGKTYLSDNAKKLLVWEVTPLGARKLDLYEGEATPKFNVLVTLKELGPSNVDEIATRAGMGRDAVLFQLKQLQREGCVRVIPIRSGDIG